MAASSVTGTGPGESMGLQKPQLHSGCGCCGSSGDAPPPARKRRVGCVVRTGTNSSVVRNTSSSGPVRSGSCF